MDLEKERLMECGRTLKKVAPIIGITIHELEKRFSEEITKITGTEISEERIHKLFCGEQWPFYYMGIKESTEAILQIAKTKMDKHNDVDFEKKLPEIKKILSLAFADFERLSYFYSDTTNPNTHYNIAGIIERIMDDLSKFQTNEFLYLLNKYLEAFLSISFLEVDILTLNIPYELHSEIPISVQSGYKLLVNPALQQWLELRNKNHKDALRKAREPQFEKMRNSLKERLNKFGFTNLASLACFIEEFLLEQKEGAWSSVTKEDIDKILIFKLFGLNEDYLNKLRSRAFDTKLERALDISDNSVALDLAKFSGVFWMNFLE